MKEQLSRDNIEALVAYRFKRAEETLTEVPFLKQQGYYNTAINRLSVERVRPYLCFCFISVR